MQLAMALYAVVQPDFKDQFPIIYSVDGLHQMINSP